MAVINHNSQKDFWQRVLVFVSLAGDKNKADVEYLERMAVELATKANRFVLDDNKQSPKSPMLPEAHRSADEEYFEDICFMVSFMGYNIFDTVVVTEKTQLYYIIESGILAKGVYDERGMTVLAESKIAFKETAGYKYTNERQKELKKYCKQEGAYYVIKQDRTFSSPSAAACFCLGRNSNGWTAWITDTEKKNAKTLDEKVRKKGTK